MHDRYVLDQGAVVPILLKHDFSPVQVCHPGRAMMAASDYGVNIAAALPYGILDNDYLMMGRDVEEALSNVNLC